MLERFAHLIMFLIDTSISKICSCSKDRNALCDQRCELEISFSSKCLINKYFTMRNILDLFHSNLVKDVIFVL